VSPSLALLLVVVLIVANGLFVAFEFGLVASRRALLEESAREGHRGAVAAVKQLDNVSFVLSSAQFGITATSLVVGFLAEDAVGGVIVDPLLELVGLPEATRAAVALTLAFLLSTVVQMLFGELGPKNLALALPETTSRRLARLMYGFGVALGPLIRLFDDAAGWTTKRVFRVDVVHERLGGHSTDEMALIISASRDEGELSEAQGELLARAVGLGDRRVHEVMVPRTRVDFLQVDDPLEALRELARRTGHSRFPVRGEDDDDVVGTVHVKDLLTVPRAQHGTTRVGQIAAPVLAVPESDHVRRLLGQLRAAHRTFALVVDEYGGIAGIVTVEDVLEELVGEIEDEFDAAPGAVRRVGPRRWLLDGTLRLDEVADATGLELAEGDYETVAGFVIDRLGRIPNTGAAVEHEGWELVAHRMDGVRLAQVLLHAAPDAVIPAGGSPQAGEGSS